MADSPGAKPLWFSASVRRTSRHRSAEYQYNGIWWRTLKRVDSDVTDSTHALDQKTVMYYGPGWQLLEERIDEDFLGDPGVDRHQVFVWGAQYIDDIIARRVDTNPASLDGYEQTWFHLTDVQFSTVGIIDEDAVIAERVTYTAYGQARHHWLADVDGDGDHDTADRDLVSSLRGKSIGDAGYRAEADLDRNGVINNTDLAIVNQSFGPQYGRAALPEGVLSSADVGNTIGYCGYVFDREVETYFIRNRVYSPVLGRWLQQDPLGYVDGMALYEYVRSSPRSFADPLGLTRGMDFIDIFSRRISRKIFLGLVIGGDWIWGEIY